MEAKFADVPEPLWLRIEPLLPAERAKPRGGRPPVAPRVVMAGILYRLKTGCQWKALPNEFGSGSTCHLRFQQWVKLGVFAEIHRELLSYYDVRWERCGAHYLALLQLACGLIAFQQAL